jgi:hypothetical protein
MKKASQFVLEQIDAEQFGRQVVVADGNKSPAQTAARDVQRQEGGQDQDGERQIEKLA